MKKSPAIVLATMLAGLLTLESQAAEPKRVIVVSVTTGFRHSSIATAEKTLQKLADESKAFTIVDFARQPEVVVPRKPSKPRELKADADEKAKAGYAKSLEKYEAEMAAWTPEKEAEMKAANEKLTQGIKAALAKLSPENLNSQHIDAVIFANTTGELPLPDRDGFIKWVEQGHAFIGTHSASDTFHPFTPYIDMLQGEFVTHGAQVPADLAAADTAHPANGGLGATFEVKQEEMYELKNHDRSKVRALWYLKHHPQRVSELGYYPVSWCRKFGKGQVFYTSLGHREDLWDDSAELPNRINSVETSKKFQAHLLGGIKWALGLAEGSSEPNPSVQ